MFRILIYIKYLNWARTKNFLLNIFSYFISILFNKNFYWGKPYAASIELANICNYKCPECITGSGKMAREKGILKLEKFKEIINKIDDTVFYLQLYFQGEPFINKEIIEIIKSAKKRKFYLSVSTNGSLLHNFGSENIVETGIDQIIFSLDDIDKDNYSKYRIGGDFEIVKNNLIDLIETKKRLKSKTPEIILQFIVMKHNEGSLEEFKKFSNSIGADKFEIKTMQIYNSDNFEKFLPASEKYSRYVFLNGQYKLKTKKDKPCFLLWKSFVIAWNGDIFPCCFDKNGEYKFGNIFADNVDNLFFDERAKSFREKVIRDKKNISICQSCYY